MSDDEEAKVYRASKRFRENGSASPPPAGGGRGKTADPVGPQWDIPWEQRERRGDTADKIRNKQLPLVNIGGMVPEPGRSRAKGDKRTRRSVQLGRRWTEIMMRINSGEMTWKEFVSTLDSTELARAQLKDKNGGFAGRPPALVPRAFYDACIKELMTRGQEAYRQNYLEAIKAMTDIATNPGVKEGDRIKAAQFVIERLEGKVPDRLVVAAEDPFREFVAGVVANVEEETAIANAQKYLERRE
jgi:hypothetical protein